MKPVVQFASPEGQNTKEVEEESLGKVPQVGEDTRAILAELLKYQETKIQHLFQAGVVE
jgi:hypothetical protein